VTSSDTFSSNATPVVTTTPDVTMTPTAMIPITSTVSSSGKVTNQLHYCFNLPHIYYC